MNKKNRLAARRFFGIEDRPDLILHHINPNQKRDDPEGYDKWDPKDLCVMTQSEHARLHNDLAM